MLQGNFTLVRELKLMGRQITFITLLLAFFAVTSNAQTLDCKKFRTGKFYYPGLPDKISLRKDSTQESYDNGKLEMLWKVKWLSECEYELTCEQVFEDPYPIKKGDRIVATIVKTEDDCFTTSIMFYNEANPEGQAIPSGEMCIKKD